MPAPASPIVNLPAFDGPLDVLLHLIREQKLDIADIPIVLITDQYLAILNDAAERKLQLAGEFFVMAATLLEIKTRMLLPKPPALQGDEDEDIDPRADLAQRVLEYQRFKALVPMLQDWEQERACQFVRSIDGIEELYDAPTIFGSASASALVKAFERLLQRTSDSDPDITSVHRKKLSLHLAMRLMMARVAEAGEGGIDFTDLFAFPIILFEAVMTFLALLELLRQRKLEAYQTGPMSNIHVSLAAPEAHGLDVDVVRHEDFDNDFPFPGQSYNNNS